MKEPYKVLFVCMGNICRSPAGECVFMHWVEKEGLEDSICAESAGTIGYHTGNSPDPRMRAAGRSRGYKIKGSARQIRTRDFEEFDLIVTMDRENLRDVRKIKPIGTHRATVKEFCEFCTEHSDSEVPDPYYGNASGFEYVLDLMEDGCKGIIAHAAKSQDI